MKVKSFQTEIFLLVIYYKFYLFLVLQLLIIKTEKNLKTKLGMCYVINVHQRRMTIACLRSKKSKNTSHWFSDLLESFYPKPFWKENTTNDFQNRLSIFKICSVSRNSSSLIYVFFAHKYNCILWSSLETKFHLTKPFFLTYFDLASFTVAYCFNFISALASPFCLSLPQSQIFFPVTSKLLN